jgi:uncharacterized protein YprB with RNaseH-like and TPR domain
MEDMQQQLAALRRRIARIDRKYAVPPPAAHRPLRPAGHHVEELLSGEIVCTPHGEHFETERLWERHRRHGNIAIADLPDLPEELLDAISDGTIPCFPATRWAFLDTETTGLGGGACAFLIGVGAIEPGGFRLRQFFMRNYDEERSVLFRLARYLDRFDVLITFNGKTYDQPLLENRFRAVRARHPFRSLHHLDLLFGARRLWKLRLPSCRLIELETAILGVERQGDLPGELVPYYYSEFLRTRRALELVPIFHHNAIDILSLACLTAVVPFAFHSPDRAPLRHGADLLGLGRWLLQAGRRPEALRIFQRAIKAGLPDHLLFRTIWDTAAIEKRDGQGEAAVALYRDLAESRNPYRVRALVALAKWYERQERDPRTALEMTLRAMAIGDSPALRKREARLRSRLK